MEGKELLVFNYPVNIETIGVASDSFIASTGTAAPSKLFLPVGSCIQQINAQVQFRDVGLNPKSGIVALNCIIADNNNKNVFKGNTSIDSAANVQFGASFLSLYYGVFQMNAQGLKTLDFMTNDWVKLFFTVELNAACLATDIIVSNASVTYCLP